MHRSESFLTLSEEMIEAVAHSGVETSDTPFIRAAQQAAADIGRLLEGALGAGDITLAELFDEDYRPIPNTNPPQHLTRFVELADRLFPQVQERLLDLSERVIFCIAVDRNGYVAAHNNKYSHPRRGDVAWDTANSRYRRIFNDRAGVAKEADAPITAQGKHWGSLRLAYKF